MFSIELKNQSKITDIVTIITSIDSLLLISSKGFESKILLDNISKINLDGGLN